jgi:hypothetical protein
VRSVSPRIFRVGLLAVCGLLLLVAIGGCSTTQDTAARKQAESKRILERRAHKQAKKKQRSKSHDHGSSKQ